MTSPSYRELLDLYPVVLHNTLQLSFLVIHHFITQSGWNLNENSQVQQKFFSVFNNSILSKRWDRLIKYGTKHLAGLIGNIPIYSRTSFLQNCTIETKSWWSTLRWIYWKIALIILNGFYLDRKGFISRKDPFSNQRTKSWWIWVCRCFFYLLSRALTFRLEQIIISLYDKLPKQLTKFMERHRKQIEKDQRNKTKTNFNTCNDNDDVWSNLR